MSYVETSQMDIMLTGEQSILSDLRRRKMLHKNNEGDEYYCVQFNSVPFEFFPGKAIRVGKTVGESLIRASKSFPLNDVLGGEPVSPLVVVRSVAVGGSPVANNTCPYCAAEFETPKKLGYHLMRCEKTGVEAEVEEVVDESETTAKTAEQIKDEEESDV